MTPLPNQQQFQFMLPPRAVQVLHLVRRTHDTTTLPPDLFQEFCRAVHFYLRGFSVEHTAKLVIQDLWPHLVPYQPFEDTKP